MTDTVAIVAIALSVISFLVYIGFSLGLLGRKETEQAVQAAQTATNQVRAVTAPTPTQVADLLKALGSLTESLVKAGPALWSLIGSALFLLIAAIAAGAIGGGSPTKSGGETGRGGTDTKMSTSNTSNSTGNMTGEQKGTPPARGGATASENLDVGKSN